MDEPAAEKAVPLVTLCNGRRIKDKVVNDFFIIKPSKRYKRRNDDDYERNRKFHSINLNVKCRIPKSAVVVFFIIENGAGPIHLLGQY